MARRSFRTGIAALMMLPLHAAIAQTAPARDPRLPLDALPVTARIDLPSSADWMAFGFGSIWVVNYRPSRLSRVDMATNRVRAGTMLKSAGTSSIDECVET